MNFFAACSTLASECGSWFNYFAEISNDGQLKLSTFDKDTKTLKLEKTIKIDKYWYVCIQKKKYICLQLNGKCFFILVTF